MKSYVFLLALLLSLLSCHQVYQSKNAHPAKAFAFDSVDTIRVGKGGKLADSVIRDKKNARIVVINPTPVSYEKMQPIDNITFKARISLKESEITSIDPNNQINLTGITFNDIAAFDASDFTKETNFIYSKFSNNTSFVGAKFDAAAVFSNATFAGTNALPTNFTRIDFTTANDFDKGVLCFDFLKFEKKPHFTFYQAKLPTLINISQNQFVNDKIDFTNADFDSEGLYKNRRWTYINLYNADINKIKIDYEHFRLCFYKTFQDEPGIKYKDGKQPQVLINNQPVDIAKLYEDAFFRGYIKRVFPQCNLTDNDYFFLSFFNCYHEDDKVIRTFVNDCLRMHKFPRSLTKEETISIYERLLKNFSSDGQTTSRKILGIEYHNFRAEWWGFVPHFWNCYGLHKEWVFIWTLIFLAIFTWLTYLLLPCLARTYILPDLISDPCDVEKANPCDEEKPNPCDVLPQLNTTWIKIKYSFTFTASIFFPLAFEFKQLKIRNAAGLYVIIVYVIGLICVGYLAAFILQK